MYDIVEVFTNCCRCNEGHNCNISVIKTMLMKILRWVFVGMLMIMHVWKYTRVYENDVMMMITKVMIMVWMIMIILIRYIRIIINNELFMLVQPWPSAPAFSIGLGPVAFFQRSKLAEGGKEREKQSGTSQVPSLFGLEVTTK